MAIASTQQLQASVRREAELVAHVGNTPLLRLTRITRSLAPTVEIHVKAEWFNPSGSVKDRAATSIIQQALVRGDLTPGRRLLDSTSGNMGIAYATFGAVLGIPVTLCVPGNASPERVKILRALGAELILTDPSEGSDGAIRRARELARTEPHRYWYANQYDNPANWHAHYLTTGPELLDQTAGAMTHFVAGLGTSGTLVGTGRYLREKSPATRIVAVEPDEAFHGLEGLKYMPTSIQPGIYDSKLADQTVGVATEDAYCMVRRLAREEGLFVGVSSGAAVAAALKLAQDLSQGFLVVVLPDAGYKYLSDRELWEAV